MDMYEMLSRAYPGWSLQDMKGLSMRERLFFIERAAARTTMGGVNLERL